MMARIFKIAFLFVLIGASLAKKAAKNEARNNFNQINTNGDRFIDLAEVETTISDRDDLKDRNAADLIAEMDKNGDGRLTFKEFWQAAKSDEADELLGKQTRLSFCVRCDWWNVACHMHNASQGC